MITADHEQSQKFLDPKTVALVSNYRLLARLIVDGFLIGHHRGPRNAFSLEYDRHRNYYPGDPLKLVDWKIYGKTDRYFVKQFEEETNLEAWLIIDISKSMGYRGKRSSVTKLKYASYLAAALAYLLSLQKDRVGIILFDEQLRKIIPPASSKRQLNLILRELQNIKEGTRSSFDQSARLVAGRIKKRSLILLFSDFLAKPEEMEQTLKYFMRKGNEVMAFHVLSFEEIQFPFRHFGFFQDLETNEKVILQPALFKDEYRRQLERYLKMLKETCRKLRISYQLLQTTAPFDQALQEFFALRAKMN